MHVLEKLWKAGLCLPMPRASLAADLWVLTEPSRILFGEVGQVVKGIRQSITKRALFGPKRKTINGVAAYLYRNRFKLTIRFMVESNLYHPGRGGGIFRKEENCYTVCAYETALRLSHGLAFYHLASANDNSPDLLTLHAPLGRTETTS
jgi:hypothetical protein